MTNFIRPLWPLPDNLRSLITTRVGGASRAPFNEFNLGAHVGDDPAAVEQNRQRLYEKVGQRVSWLQQTHSTDVAVIGSHQAEPLKADAVFSNRPGVVCAVLSADCLPVLLADRSGCEIAAIHAGWRGLAAGIIEQSLHRFESRRENLLAFLGPAISQENFEVGEDVLDAFKAAEQARDYAQPVTDFFLPSAKCHRGENKYRADLYGLAQSELAANGVSQIFGGDFCTYADARFFSYRREGQCGRMATLIWREK